MSWDQSPPTQAGVSLRSARSFRMLTAPIGVKTGIPPIVKQTIQQHQAQQAQRMPLPAPPPGDDEVTRFVPRLAPNASVPYIPSVTLMGPLGQTGQPPEREPSRPQIAVAIARKLAIPMIAVALTSAVVTYFVMRSRAPSAPAAVALRVVPDPVPPAPAPAAPAVTVTPIPEAAPATTPATTTPPQTAAPASEPVAEVAATEHKRKKRAAALVEDSTNTTDDADEATDEIAAAPTHDEPAADAAVGLLMISTKPPCKIVIDGKPTGLLTPQRGIRLAPGLHRVELVNETEAIRSTATVEISADQSTKLIRNFMLSQS